MSATTSPYKPPEAENLELHYRSLSKAAIACLVFGVFSLSAFLLVPALIFPLICIGCGLIAWNNFRQFPGELMGSGITIAGMVLGFGSLFGAIALHSYVYATEVPDGYQRISFRMLRDDPKTPLKFAEEAERLDGMKVFVKGYVRPSTNSKGLTEFIMVSSFGECCFGGQEKPTDVIGVRLQTGETVDVDYTLRKIAGVFRLNRDGVEYSEKGIPQVVYQIDADYLK